MFKKISLALLVGVSTLFGTFEAPAQAKQYESPDAYCTEQKNSVPQSLSKSEKEAVYDRCMQAVQNRPDKFPDVKISQGKSESSEASVEKSARVEQTQPAPKPESRSVQTTPSGSDQTSTRSSLPQQPTGSSNGRSDSSSNEDFGALPGNQKAGDPLKKETSIEEDQSQEDPVEKQEEPKSAEPQMEKEQSSPETRESSKEDKQSADEQSAPQKSPEDTQEEESVLDEKDGESTEETDKTPGEKERSTKHENVSSESEKNAETQSSQLSEQKVDRFCGKQNIMAETGSEKVYNRCITQVEKHPDEFPQLHKSETTKPSADSEDEASASDASSASEEKNANESEKQEQIENKEEREREDRDKDGKVQTETSVDQPTPNEGENAEKGNNDPPQKLRNMSHSELYDRFCNVKEISGDAPRQKMVQKVVNKHVQCHKRMIRAIQKEKYAQMRTMIQQQRKKMQEERPTLQVKAAAQFSGNGDLQTRVGVQDQRFNAQAVYRPNSERSLDVSATHQITDKEDEFPLNILTPVRVGAGLKNVHGETSIGPRINAGILELQVDVVNGNGVSAGINIFNF